MPKKLLRLLSAVLAAAGIFSCTSCAGSNQTQKSASSGSTNQVVTLSIMGLFDSQLLQNGTQSDPVAKYIEKHLGVRMDIIVADTTGDVGSKVNAMIATDDLPDIMYLPDAAKQLMAAEKAGRVLALDSYLPKYGKNLTSVPLSKFCNAYFKKMSSVTIDGKLYGLATSKGRMSNSYIPDVANYVRWDLYKKLGYPTVSNYDDLLTVLKKMQELEPQTKDGKKTYGIGTRFGDDGTPWEFQYVPGYTNGVLCLGSCWSFNATTNSISDKDIYTDTSSSWWQLIDFLNKAYRMGLLDPDSITQKDTQFEEKADSGQYLCIFPGGTAVAANQQFIKDGESDKGFVALKPFSEDAFCYHASAPTGCYDIAISSKCKYPEKAVQFLDWCNSYEGVRILANGVEGTNWKMVNGKPTATKAYTSATIDNAFKKKTGAELYQYIEGLQECTIDPTYNQPLNLLDETTVQDSQKTKVEKEAENYYGTTLEKLYGSAKTNTFSWDVPAALNDTATSMSSSMKINENMLVKYVNNFAKSKLVFASSDSAYQTAKAEFIASVKKYHVDEIFNYYKKQGKTIDELYAELIQSTGFDLNKDQ